MKKVRAKFQCTLVNDKPEFEQKEIYFSAVIYGGEENKSFSKYTPSGTLELTVTYDTEASKLFEEGKEYYLDIIPV